MAAQMQEWGMQIGEHLICDDGEPNIKAALQFLLSRHDAVITVGGLGPTSDDVTRKVVADVVGKSLAFHQESWDKIVTRLTRYNLVVSENNRQQAYFPQGSEVINNAFGTANACRVSLGNKVIFMLPGPPKECLPTFQEAVLPYLRKHDFQSPARLFRWRLMGVSESLIAEKLDVLAKAHHLEFAYRAAYPFTDIKLMLDPHCKNHSKILMEVESLVRPYFATHLDQTLTAQLRQYLSEKPKTLFIEDEATHDYFLQKLMDTHTEPLFVKQAEKAGFHIKITGLKAFWNQNRDPDHIIDSFDVTIDFQGKTHHCSSQVFLRGEETLDFVAEFVAMKVLGLL
jgi:nicotinamide-nucleotide amidase